MLALKALNFRTERDRLCYRAGFNGSRVCSFKTALAPIYGVNKISELCDALLDGTCLIFRDDASHGKTAREFDQLMP